MAKKKKLRMRKANLILLVLLGLAILFVIVEDYYYEDTPVEEDYQTLWNFEGSIVWVDNKWLENIIKWLG